MTATQIKSDTMKNKSYDISGVEVSIHDKVTICEFLTTDPFNKRGHTGKIKAINKFNDIDVEFEDGTTGRYCEMTFYLSQ